MAISVECPSCWRALTFEDSAGGTEVKCSHCLNTFTLPAAEEPAGAYGLAAPVVCPSCRREAARDAVLCVQCGYNFRTGKKRKQIFEEKDFVHTIQGTRYAFRRDRRGRWTLEMEGRLLGFRTSAKEFDLGRCTSAVAVYQHDGSDEGEEFVTIFLEGPTGRRDRIFFGLKEGLVEWLEEILREEVGLPYRVERA
jgi:LSD1 subclass zinc finger protein